MNSLHRFTVALIIPLLAVMLGSCSSSQQIPQNPEPLGEAEYALCFSKQSPDMYDKSKDSKVVLAEKDGSFSEIQTWGMDRCSMEWTEKGLFFSDRRNDYLLSDQGLSTVESPKTDSQYAMIATDPDTVVGLYNLGFTETGYASQVVITDGKSSSLTTIEGGYFTASQCNGTIFGVGRAIGPYSKTGDPETEPMLLNQLTGTANGKEKYLGSSSAEKDATVLEDAPCVDGKIIYVAEKRPEKSGDPSIPILSIWDIETGKNESIDMHSDDIESLMSDDGTWQPQVTAQSIKGGKLEWYGVENSIMSTDLRTGETKRKFTVEGVSNQSAFSKALFLENEVLILVDNNDGSKYRIIRYDRETGKELGRTVLDISPEKLSSGFYLRGFSVRP